MASPLTITTTAVVVVPRRLNRVSLRLQNTGENIIYVKREIPNTPISTPSATNYDILLPKSGAEENSVAIESTASFWAVSATGTSTLAVLETVRV